MSKRDKHNIKYAVAMSGGVDSSAVAAILQKEGYDIFGITMHIHNLSEDSVINAEKVCRKLGLEHFVIDARKEFKKSVIDVFASYYARGLTPNPCAICNRDIKLKLLLKFAKEKGADLMATGHYANLHAENDDVILTEARNKRKDQSYFLSLVSRDNLKYVRFPLGNIEDKAETREIAAKLGLHNFEQKDSQDICFIAEGTYKDFLKAFYPELPLFVAGDIKLVDSNKVISKHNGLANYTIGQRRGLGISHSEPLYVIGLDTSKNEVIVGQREYLQNNQFQLFETNWLAEVENSFDAFVKLRSSSEKTLARIHKTESSIALLETSSVPITGGQICTIYTKENRVIGGGIITQN